MHANEERNGGLEGEGLRFATLYATNTGERRAAAVPKCRIAWIEAHRGLFQGQGAIQHVRYAQRG